jgi:hypothetical protein
LSAAQSHALPGFPNVVVVGDITGDGRDDAVVVSDSVEVFLQQGNGTLGEPQSYAHVSEGGGEGYHAALIQLDPNRLPDLVLGYNNGIGILRNDGNGRFPTETRIMSNSLEPHRIRIVDVDRDGNPDILVGGYGDFLFTAYLSNGQGNVRNQLRFVPHGQYSVVDFALADATGDGILDAIALTNYGPYQLAIYPWSGAGFAADPRALSLTKQPAFVHSVDAGDVDGDGRSDFAITYPSNRPTSIGIFRQNAPGSFLQEQLVDSSDIPEPVLVADMDGDGGADVVVLHGGWNQAGVYLQRGGSLEKERVFDIPYASHYENDGLAIGDLDSDGCKDLAIADYNNGLVVLYGRDCARPR